MEVGSSEMLVTICVTTWCHIPQDGSFYVFKLPRWFFFFACTSDQLLGDITGAKTESITREQGDEHVDTYSHLKMVAIVKRDVIVLFLQPKREAHVQSVLWDCGPRRAVENTSMLLRMWSIGRQHFKRSQEVPCKM